jgi:hypothetical protein
MVFETNFRESSETEAARLNGVSLDRFQLCHLIVEELHQSVCVVL